ncbi:NAD(P)/FAD-dependent oxidoreductase [Rubritalea tangerina]|uniref:NAD(P)/FAD-dependent oxidoreductase n=1 Tax=Rubritalea tangerina TaxID=430798 RepID=A0ABW4Z979_9BACT
MATDTLIYGAGPAGCIAATWLAQAGRPVALLHKPPRTPLCRIESLGPDILPLINKIGLHKQWLNDLALPIPGTISRWSSDKIEYHDAVMSPHGHAWSVHRQHFDSKLLDYAKRNGVTIVDKKIPSQRQLIATGSDLLPNGIVHDKLVALTRNYTHLPLADKRLRIEAVPQGWWYAIPARNNTFGLGFVTDRQMLLNQSPQQLWNQALPDSLALLLIPSSVKASPIRSYPVRCAISKLQSNRIGNARASYDPLTGRGTAEAVKNALTTVSLQTQDRSNYQLDLDHQYSDYLTKRHHLYLAAERRFQTKFWSRRIATLTTS